MALRAATPCTDMRGPERYYHAGRAYWVRGWRSTLRLVLLVVGAEGCRADRAAFERSHVADVKRVVLGITDSIATAVGRKDVPRLAQLLEDAQYIGSGLLIPPGHFAEVAGPAFGQIPSITLTWEQREIRPLSPTVVLMTARGTNMTRDAAGAVTSEAGLYTMIFARESAGSWRLMSLHKTTGPGAFPPIPAG